MIKEKLVLPFLVFCPLSVTLSLNPPFFPAFERCLIIQYRAMLLAKFTLDTQW